MHIKGELPGSGVVRFSQFSEPLSPVGYRPRFINGINERKSQLCQCFRNRRIDFFTLLCYIVTNTPASGELFVEGSFV